MVQDAVISVASPGYFRTMGVALRRGRLFEARDSREAPAVALINETLARRYFPNEDPIGHRILGGGSVRIVGVVANVRQLNVTAEPKAQIYLPHAQRSWSLMTLVVRTATDPAAMAAALRNELRLMDKSRPLSNIKIAEQIFSEAVAGRRFAMVLLALFAALALLVAAIGLYGVIATDPLTFSSVAVFFLAVALLASRASVQQGVPTLAPGVAGPPAGNDAA